MKKSPVFKETARYYLHQLERLPLTALAPRLALEIQGQAVMIPILGKTFCLEPGRLLGPDGRQAPFEALVVASRYLIGAPETAPTDEAWTAYRDFPDAAPLVSYFQCNAEAPIAQTFSGRTAELAAHCQRIGGRPLDGGLHYDLALGLQALPRIPIYLLFNDEDPEFGAECRLLFERRAADYLDMESLAILGVMLAAQLVAAQP